VKFTYQQSTSQFVIQFYEHIKMRTNGEMELKRKEITSARIKLACNEIRKGVEFEGGL
jgi:hypothetical protein